MNNPPSLDRQGFYQSIVLIVLILILAGGMGVYVISDPFLNEALIMVRAASLVRNLYHEQIDWETALDAAR